MENKCSHSKTAISVMFWGNTVGRLLPPYTVYKAEQMWDTWHENGPEGAPRVELKLQFQNMFISIFIAKIDGCITAQRRNQPEVWILQIRYTSAG